MALTISPGTAQDTAKVAQPFRKLVGIISPAPAAVSARKRLLKWDPLIGKACDSEPDVPIAWNMFISALTEHIFVVVVVVVFLGGYFFSHACVCARINSSEIQSIK